MPRKALLLILPVCVAFLLIAFQGAAAGPANVICSPDTESFTGTARDLTGPAGTFCSIANATITHDLVVQPGAGVAIARTTIGHDVVATQPQTVQTGQTGPPPAPAGPVQVGHDFVISGSPPGEAFHGLCNLTVGHDLRVVGTTVNFGIGLGDQCAGQGRPADTVGHDLVVTGNRAVANDFFVASINVGDNRVGHDLIFTGNTAAPGGGLEVSDNVVGHDAVCSANSPVPAPSAGDGPNTAGHANTCG